MLAFTAVGAGLVVCTVLAGYLHGSADHAALAQSGRSWLAYRSMENARGDRLAALSVGATLDDQPLVDAASADMAAEEAAALSGLPRRLDPTFLVGGGARRTEHAVQAALLARREDLRALSSWLRVDPGARPAKPMDPSVRASTAEARVARLVAIVANARSVAMSDFPAFAAADRLMARLAVWSDQPMGVVLAATSADDVLRLDVDRSTARHLYLGGTGVVSGSGFVAWVVDGTALIANLDPTPTIRVLRSASRIIVGAGPGRLWLDDSYRGVVGYQSAIRHTVTELDLNANVVVPPTPVPPNDILAGGATDTGLPVRTASGALAVWNPSSGRQTWIAAAGQFVASTPHAVAFSTSGGPIHLLDVDNLDTRTISLPNGASLSDSAGCALSPDDATLACALYVSGTYELGVADVDSRRMRLIPGVQSQILSSLTWAPDSSRLYLLAASPGWPSIIAAWSRNDESVTELRYRPGGALNNIVVLRTGA